MAGSIKGIIVEIGGDTSGLQKALKSVNSATASLSKELKGINSLLKLDPKNTELLSQKQTVLNKEIEVTNTKLEELKKHQEEVANSGVQLTEEQEKNYRDLQREIISTQNKLSDLKNEASNWTKASEAINKFGDNLKIIGDTVNNIGNKLTTRLTVPIVSAFTLATKEAIEFESSFTGVTKTVDGTEEQLERLKQGIKDLSKEIPSSTTEISAVAEAAGQLGIQTDNILNFTKTMINMGNATNLSAEEAATTLARFANITGMSQSDFDKLGSVIVALGNNFATTEAEVANMGMNLASAGTQIGMSQSEIMALATALSSVGLEAQAGGTAFSKVMVNMQLAVEKGGKDLKNFATVAGMSTEQFKKSFKEDATSAIMQFIEGLSKSGERGKSAIKVLDDMGITETRLRDALLRSANASEVMNDAIKLGNEAWETNTALTEEASKRYKTTESQFKITKNKIKDVSASLGNKLLPVVNKLIDKADKWIDKLDALSESEKENIVKIGLWVAAAGPMLKIIGNLTSTVGSVTKGIGTFTQAIGLAHNGIGTATGSAANLAKVFQGLKSPIGLATIGITASVATVVTAIQSVEKETKKSLTNVGNAATDFIKGIDTATSHLDSFNSTLFASAEEQQELENQMDEIQSAITKICKTASDERRDYTQEEIVQLNEYFEKLRELKNRELEIQQSISSAITQQAEQQAQVFDGNLEEYKVLSQEWIKTIKEQANAEITIINDRTTQEIALLQQRYGDKANLENEEYAKEYAKIIEAKDNAIQQANDEVSKINQIYSTGYLKRTEQENGFYEVLKEYNKKQEEETKLHNKNIEEIENNRYMTNYGKNQAIERENNRHRAYQGGIWKNMYEDMNQSQEEQLGVWLSMVAETEMYGGEIDEETKEIVDSIIESFDDMPNGTKKVAKETMEGLLKGMQDKEPTLYAKASGIANGILNRLKKSFDIHSPSKETRDIFQNVMKGAELGLEDEQNKLNKQVDIMANQMKTNFANMIPNMGAIKQSVIDQTKTVFTTPSIIINAQDELTPSKINSIIDTVNRRLGSQY